VIARAWYVRCDECGNPSEISTDSAKDAKAYARAQGYLVKRIDGRERWLCPWGCRQDAEAELPPDRDGES
jgi:hypothetical protein